MSRVYRAASFVLRDAVDGAASRCDRHSERTIAVSIGRRDLHQRNIERQSAVTKERGNFGEKNRSEIRTPVLHGRSNIRTDEERVMAHVFREFGRCGRSERSLDDLYGRVESA